MFLQLPPLSFPLHLWSLPISWFLSCCLAPSQFSFWWTLLRFLGCIFIHIMPTNDGYTPPKALFPGFLLLPSYTLSLGDLMRSHQLPGFNYPLYIRSSLSLSSNPTSPAVISNVWICSSNLKLNMSKTCFPPKTPHSSKLPNLCPSSQSLRFTTSVSSLNPHFHSPYSSCQILSFLPSQYVFNTLLFLL